MAGEIQDNVWPLPKFKFQVTFTDPAKIQVQFSEVSGLDAEAQIIEYRHGNSKENWAIKMPGIQKFNNVTLKRGVFVGNNDYFDWFAKIKANTIKRADITIQLLNQDNEPTMTWNLSKAWPTKVTSTDLKSDANEAAIETLEIAFESLTIKNENKPGTAAS
ncbi:MAG: phage tail protein [Bacteroidia bacterium]|nr:phage tail protein [Bacteroidia bacterium]